jgi:HSP20 family protein
MQITAHREHESEQREEGYLRKERGSMRFFRQIPLPDKIARDGIKAKMENGILDLSLPKTMVIEDKKNRIEVE